MIIGAPSRLTIWAQPPFSSSRVTTTPAWSDGQSPYGSRSDASSPTSDAFPTWNGPRVRTRSTRSVSVEVGFRRLVAWQQVKPGSDGWRAAQASDISPRR